MAASPSPSDPELTEFHQAQIERYIKFAIMKRNEALRDVEVAFRDAKTARLLLAIIM